ncbi:MAG: GNAT family N-acetyltransferase [Telluria sp.]
MGAHPQLSPSRNLRDAMIEPARTGWRFATSWAASTAELRAAQRLRYTVFADEMGARLTAPPGTAPGHDADRFDDYCDHLLVHVVDPLGEEPARLVGTYRVLSPDGARRAGGYYSEAEFDLAPLRPLRHTAVELGRACVDAEWRSGGVVMALWHELGSYMLRHRLDTMFGCASIGIADGGLLARRIWRHVSGNQLAAAEWQLRPLRPLERLDEAAEAEFRLRDLPPLLKGYLRCGAKVLGPPSLDPHFSTADLPIMLRLDELSARYRKQFLNRQ